MKNVVKLAVLALLVGMFSGCDFILDPEAPTPTETLMQENMWEVTAVYDENDPYKNIADSLRLGLGNAEVPFVFNMKDLNDFNSTAGPLFLYLVYGDSKWTNIAGKVDQVFDYLDADAIASGTWGLGSGVVSTFMFEVKLQPPGFNSLVSVIEDLFGLQAFSQKIDKYALHKFKKVEVSFEGDKMIWEVTDQVETEYTTQVWSDAQSDLVEIPFAIEGNNYSRCIIEFEKFRPITSSESQWYKNLLK